MVAWLPGTYHVPAVGSSTPSMRRRSGDLPAVMNGAVMDSFMLKILITSEALAVSRWYSIYGPTGTELDRRPLAKRD